MKVLLVNGSPRANGNTGVALREMVRIFEAGGVETDTMCIGAQPVRGCVACGRCSELGRCAFDDCVNEAAAKLAEADGLVVATPVYYGAPNGTVVAFLNRLFYSCSADLRMKVGAGVVICRRGGASSSFDDLNKYFTISGMPVASSQYWNSVHGRTPGQAAADGEGLQTVRQLARNMVFLMKSIALGREAYGLPEREERVWTHFIQE